MQAELRMNCFAWVNLYLGGDMFAFLLLAATATVIAVIAFAVLVAPVRDDRTRCARGRFTYWFLLAGYVIGGFVAILVGRSGESIVYACLGLVVGAAIGNIVVRIVGHRFRLQDEETVA